MTTTSLKLSQEIKQLAAAEAKRQGVSPHAFMVDAIKMAVLAAEKRAVFVADAVAARNDSINSGLGHEADEVHAYLRARVQGTTAIQPKDRPWRN